MIKPFPMIEAAVKEAIETGIPEWSGKVGGDLSYDGTSDVYIWVHLFAGTTDATIGDFVVDIDCFAPTYAAAMNAALKLEAFLLNPGGKRTSTMVIDRAVQSQAPTERPWDDEGSYRVGGTYTLDARRRSS